MVGNRGDNVLDGGAGNDTYVVDNAGDRTFETTSFVISITTAGVDAGGTDTVIASVSQNLGAYAAIRFVETFTLTGTADLSGVGNALDNRIIGNAGDNLIAGGAGHDTLTGGDGHNRFVFNAAPVTATADVITDFLEDEDRIYLDDAVFAGLATGWLAAAAFTANTRALIATLDAGLDIDNTHFSVY